MRFGLLLGAVSVAIVSTALFASQASAFCGTVAASGTGETRQQALMSANNKGLKQTNKLDRDYHGQVSYQQAKVDCQESHVMWNCRITQAFCTNN